MRVIRHFGRHIPGQISADADHTPADDLSCRMNREPHPAEIRQLFQDTMLDPLPERFTKVVEMLGGRPAGDPQGPGTATVWWISPARHFPAARSAQLQTLARGETGGLLALAYSNMRGYGSVHPVIGELRVGFLPVPYKNPGSGSVECLGEIQVTEAEVISRIAGAEGPALLSLGYGLCFGHNETKAIAMAVLDRAMAARSLRRPPRTRNSF
jgi:alpha-D-ribose 1-methylphosphonate 5-triphosphate synthase subunit PhnI